MTKNHCDPAAGCKPKAEVSPANGKPMALVAKWMSVSIRGPAQWRSRKTASSQRGQEFTMYHHQDYILAHGRHSQPRTSRGQRSYKDKRCRQRSRKYETRGVAEERLARIWPGPTAVIARHHHCTGQLPEACCSSSVVSGRKWNITGIIIKTSFLWNLRGIQTQMEYMNRVLCRKKKPALKWTSADTTNHRFTTIAGLVNCITKESRLSGSQQSVMAVPVKWL